MPIDIDEMPANLKFTDPWGNEYIYENPPRKSKKFDLYTLGADGAEGGSGEDTDIGNWMQ